MLSLLRHFIYTFEDKFPFLHLSGLLFPTLTHSLTHSLTNSYIQDWQRKLERANEKRKTAEEREHVASAKVKQAMNSPDIDGREYSQTRVFFCFFLFNFFSFLLVGV